MEKTDYSSYDASKFLREAIGDEIAVNNSVKSDPEAYDIVDDFLNLNTSVDNSYPASKKNNSTRNDSFSVGNISTISRFNHSSEMYKTIKDKLRNSFRRSRNYINTERRKLSEYIFDDRHKSSKPSNSINKTNLNDLEKYKSHYNDRTAERIYQTFSSKLSSNQDIPDAYLLTLINQITYQRAIRHQLSNAVSICRNTREFESSPELIEAERLLLVSNLKELAAKKELVRIDYENNGQVCNESKCKGSVMINKIEFTLKENVVKDTVFNYFYICICSYNERIISTQAVERTNNIVKFSNCHIYFENLDPEYEIKVEVYALRLRKSIRNCSHESRYHLNKVNSFIYICINYYCYIINITFTFRKQEILFLYVPVHPSQLSVNSSTHQEHQHYQKSLFSMLNSHGSKLKDLLK